MNDRALTLETDEIDGFSLNRRALLKTGVAASFVLAVSAQGVVYAQGAAPAKKYGAASMPGGTVDNPLVFVSIADDGQVTIVASRVEMGTGVRTSLPMVVADEMDADWARVTVVQADADEARYGNQNVDGSRSVRHFFEPMRRCGAAARQMLEAAAAAQWSVPVAEVKATLHEVVHEKTGQRLGYGQLAKAAAKQPIPPDDKRRLKTASEFRYIGKEVVRAVDLQNISRGTAKYGIDPHMPGMVFAVIARPAVLGAALKSYKADRALKVPGVIKVVEIPKYTGPTVYQPLGGLAVVASNTWAAIQGRNALELNWSESENARYDSVSFRKLMQDVASKPGKAVRNNGDAVAALQKADPKNRFTAEYYIPHLAHASMEPPSATVLIKDDGTCDIWSSVQDPQNALDNVVKLVGTAKEKTTLHPLLIGGAFGRKSNCDFVTEAAFIAKAMPGRPVKVVWTREDDVQHDFYHTVSIEHLEAAIGPDGMPTAWLHRTVAPTIGSLYNPKAEGESPGEYGMGAVNLPYEIPNFRVETGDVPAMTRIGWFRSVINIPHAFATQCFVAELAHRAGQDPKEYALKLIGPPRKINPLTAFDDISNYSESPLIYPFDTGRQRDVIEAACKGAGWGRKLPKGHGLGLGFSYCFMTYTATVVEVAVDDKGGVTVVAADMAIDCGPQVMPERIRAQMEGAVIMGLSLALMSEITFQKGAAVQSNFNSYLVARHTDSPPVVRTHLVNNHLQTPPGGVGEPPLPPVAPAIANAIFAATGKRIRDLPIKSLS